MEKSHTICIQSGLNAYYSTRPTFTWCHLSLPWCQNMFPHLPFFLVNLCNLLDMSIRNRKLYLLEYFDIVFILLLVSLSLGNDKNAWNIGIWIYHNSSGVSYRNPWTECYIPMCYIFHGMLILKPGCWIQIYPWYPPMTFGALSGSTCQYACEPFTWLEVSILFPFDVSENKIFFLLACKTERSIKAILQSLNIYIFLSKA